MPLPLRSRSRTLLLECCLHVGLLCQSSVNCELLFAKDAALSEDTGMDRRQRVASPDCGMSMLERKMSEWELDSGGGDGAEAGVFAALALERKRLQREPGRVSLLKRRRGGEASVSGGLGAKGLDLDGWEPFGHGASRWVSGLFPDADDAFEGAVCHEAGGGGDCLFLSVALGLQLLSVSFPKQSQLLRSKISSDFAAASLPALAASLRDLVADEFLRLPEVDFLNAVVGFVAEAMLFDWRDHWAPSRLLRNVGARQLIRASSVLAVQEVSAPDFLVHLEVSGGEEQFVWNDGIVGLQRLRREIASMHRVVGNSHWGTYSDICTLCHALDVGIMVFSDVDTGAA